MSIAEIADAGASRRRWIDLDQNATTPLLPAVAAAMERYGRQEPGGNPESRHAGGRASRRALDWARETVARILKAEPDEVVFTSGGTEANNLGVLGLAGEDREGGRVVASALEHPAVGRAIDFLEQKRGYARSELPVGRDGRVELASLSAAGLFGEGSTRLATLMLASNETGALQPVAELSRWARAAGVPVHCDAVQAAGRIPVDFQRLGVATLAISAHKFHGPAGIGALLVRRGTSLTPRSFGGGQEAGRRAGTVPVALAVGLAEALRLAHETMAERIERWRSQQARLEQGLVAGLPPGGAVVLGPHAAPWRLPQTSLVAFPGASGSLLQMGLDLAGVAASVGSACASGSTQPSPTVMAMNLPAGWEQAAVRFSFGATTTDQDVDEAVPRILEILRKRRG